jgi:hypothetical protein
MDIISFEFHIQVLNFCSLLINNAVMSQLIRLFFFAVLLVTFQAAQGQVYPEAQYRMGIIDIELLNGKLDSAQLQQMQEEAPREVLHYLYKQQFAAVVMTDEYGDVQQLAEAFISGEVELPEYLLSFKLLRP